MKLMYLFLFGFCALQLQGQATYTASNYAVTGDIVYLTAATDLGLDFETTGSNLNWNFSALNGTSQEALEFKNPISTGFLWPFIYNSNNTNLATKSTNGPTFNTGGQFISVTDSFDYFKKSTTELKQVASAYKINFNGTQIPITNQYSDADVVIKFPITFGTTDNDNSAYTISIPTLLYQDSSTERSNEIDGWGSLTTPYGTFSNVLRMKTILVQNDSISLLETGLPRTFRTTRELKWFDTSKKYPLLTVTQSNAAGNWITTNVTYLDDQRDFQTVSLFVYSPLNPNAGDTVNFQNSSTNATTYSWNFGDPTSGLSNSSTAAFPNHLYAGDGIYTVTLTASNGSFSDSSSQQIIIGSLGLQDIDSLKQLAVVPNPFESKIIVNKDLGDAFYILSNTDGKLIFRGKNLIQNDFSALASGIYYLTIVAKSETKKLKLIKK